MNFVGPDLDVDTECLREAYLRDFESYLADFLISSSLDPDRKASIWSSFQAFREATDKLVTQYREEAEHRSNRIFDLEEELSDLRAQIQHLQSDLIQQAWTYRAKRRSFRYKILEVLCGKSCESPDSSRAASQSSSLAVTHEFSGPAAPQSDGLSFETSSNPASDDSGQRITDAIRLFR